MADSASDLLRKKIAEVRKKLPPEEVVIRSAKISENFLTWLKPQTLPEAPLFGWYCPGDPNLLNEADPMPLLNHEALAFAHFAFPRVLDPFHRLMDFAIPMHATDWMKGAYGLPAPRHELPRVEPAELDLVLVPGVAFDEAGGRIGMGAGFYDRYLGMAREALRVGFAYDFQVNEKEIPQETWDARVDVVITESRIIETSARI